MLPAHHKKVLQLCVHFRFRFSTRVFTAPAFPPLLVCFPILRDFFFAFLRINAGSKSMTTTTLRAILDVQQMACENIYIFFCCVLSLRLVRLKDGMMLRLLLRAKKKGNREYD